jgi:serine/threonine protein kinase
VKTGATAEFATRLRALGVEPRRRDIWLTVGKPSWFAGWKLHVSATTAGVDRLFARVLPCLTRRHARFKIAAGHHEIVQLNAGSFGEAQIGKVVTVYPRNDSEAAALADELIECSRGIVGPRIATDLHLGAAVYARYGSVSPRVVYDRFGDPSELIPDGRGGWQPDLRPVPFRCPAGIAVPFATAARGAPLAARDKARGLLAGRYFVTDVLYPRLAGNVLRAIDVGGRGKPAAYVLKQARPHYSTDALGRDRRARLRHEGVVLMRLRGLGGVASGGDYFEEDEVGYLPVAYVRGRALGTLVSELVTGRSWRRLRAPVRRRLLRHAAQLVRRLRSAHARGVVHRDVAPANVWIGDDDQVYLLDWECAHVLGSRTPAFRLGTPGFSDRSQEQGAPGRGDDWQACGRVLAFLLTGLDPAVVVHGTPRDLATRFAVLTELCGTELTELLALALADEPAADLDAPKLLAAIAAAAPERTRRSARSPRPLLPPSAHESVVAEGLEILTTELRARLGRQRGRRAAREAASLDAHAGIAGLLYLLATAHRAGVAALDTQLAERAARMLMAAIPVTPDLAGLVHGSAGRALAVAAAVQAGCVRADDPLRGQLAAALAGPVDWPDFTHGAAGQGFAALACARRLGAPELGAGAAACAAYLVRTQSPDGAWTLPEGAPGASGQRFTGFAHGAAGVMGFLGSYAALAGDAAADAAWRRAEAWLVSRARRGRRESSHWPQSDALRASSGWWCHGAPGIALGWLTVARAQGVAAISGEHLRRALRASPHKLRSDSLSQCHGLAGIGEVYLEAHRVLGEERWRECAADIADLLVALFRSGSHQPWYYLPGEPATGAAGLMLGTAGIVHFLLRCRYPDAVTNAPLLA